MSLRGLPPYAWSYATGCWANTPQPISTLRWGELLRFRRGAGRFGGLADLYRACWIDCGWGSYHQILGPRRQLPKFADVGRRYSDLSVHYHPHLVWQAAKGDVERTHAFGSISHKDSP